jgi:hypothetical protein
MKQILAALALVLFANVSLAESAPPSQVEAIDRLDFLLGEWKGSGWVLTREGKRETFSSTESIKKKLLGTALLIEGIHTGFEAMAVVTFDSKAKQYRWRSFTSRGGGADVEARLTGERVLQWYPSTSSRYKIEISESGQWEEVGEYSRDEGKTWTQFFEMRLQRIEP